MNRIAQVKQYDIANGKGIRTSIFFSGCEHGCKGCFNSELWSFDVGEEFTREFYETKIKPTINDHVAGISILGGEPLHKNNVWSVYQLVRWFKKDFPNKTVWIWTGFTIEELFNDEFQLNNLDLYGYMDDVWFEILNYGYTDVLVEGRFVESERDLTLKWCGSRNQRVIDVKESFKQGKIVLYEN